MAPIKTIKERHEGGQQTWIFTVGEELFKFQMTPTTGTYFRCELFFWDAGFSQVDLWLVKGDELDETIPPNEITTAQEMAIAITKAIAPSLFTSAKANHIAGLIQRVHPWVTPVDIQEVINDLGGTETTKTLKVGIMDAIARELQDQPARTPTYRVYVEDLTAQYNRAAIFFEEDLIEDVSPEEAGMDYFNTHVMPRLPNDQEYEAYLGIEDSEDTYHMTIRVEGEKIAEALIVSPVEVG